MKKFIHYLVIKMVIIILTHLVSVRRNSAKIFAILCQYNSFIDFETIFKIISKNYENSIEYKEGILQALINLNSVIKTKNQKVVEKYLVLSFEFIKGGLENKKILTYSLTLFGGLFGFYSKWPKDIHKDLLEKLFIFIENVETNVMVKSEVLDVLINYSEFNIEEFIKREKEIFKMLFDEDYLIRGKSSILIGKMIKILINKQENEKVKIYKKEFINAYQMEKNSLGLKMYLQGFEHFLPISLNEENLKLLIDIIDRKETFWNTKQQLLSLISYFDYSILEFYQNKNQSISQIILSKIFEFLKDEDIRVRIPASVCLMDVIPSLQLMKEPEIISFQRMITDREKDFITDREMLNLHYVIEHLLAQMKCGEKNIIDGILKFFILAAQKYPFSFLENYSKEIIDEMMDLLKFRDFSSDITIHLQIIDVIKLYFSNQSSKTYSVVKYLIHILNLLDDFKKTGHDVTKFSNCSEIFTRKNFEKHYNILFTSFNSYGSKFSNDDKIEQLRTKLLQSLAKVIQIGSDEVIVKNSFEIIETIEKHFMDRKNVILCIQELFIRIFGIEEKEKETKKFMDYENVDIFDMLNLRKKFVKPSKLDRKNSFFLSDKLSDPAFIKLVEEMERIFVREIKAISDTHFEEIQDIIISLVSKLIIIAQHNTDKGFLKRLMNLLREQGVYLINNNLNYSRIQLITTLKFLIQFNPPELSDEKLIDVVSNLSLKDPNFVESLTPLLISSWSIDKGDLKKNIFEIFLTNIHSPNCLKSLGDFLHSIKSNNQLLKKISLQIIVQLIKDPCKDHLMYLLDVMEIEHDALDEIWKGFKEKASVMVLLIVTLYLNLIFR